MIILPLNHYDLNAIEFALAKTKRNIRVTNMSINFSLKKLKVVMREAAVTTRKKDRKECCNHIQQLKQEIWEKDGILEEDVDRLFNF